ncbi:MAG: hypothetical protein NT040_02005 [Bacteroidetes bacterium]|nr:hypothetical protein [Bacteroidota bacterium]
MKTIITVFLFFAATSLLAQVGINDDGSSPDTSAMLDVKSAFKGFLPPRMTAGQMNAIISPSEGLLVYNLTANALYWYNGTSWKRFNETTFTETDPVFTAHPAHGISAADITKWDTAYTNRVVSATGTAPFTLGISHNRIAGSMTPANALTDGYLRSIDWISFNSRLAWADTLTQLATAFKLMSRQKVSDTITSDATRYWVNQQHFLAAPGDGFIHNQSSVAQQGTFRINGNGIFDGGKVGIGVINPMYLLDVNAGNNVRFQYLLTGSGNEVLVTDAMGVVSKRQGVFDIYGYSPIQTTGGSTPTISLGTVPATNGGTGLTSYTTGDLLVANSPTSFGKLPDVAQGYALISGGAGTPPSYGKIGLGSHVTGTLTVGNGGTGATNLSGYARGNGINPFTASLTIPGADISGDIPGDAANVNGVVAVINGGTGYGTLAANKLLVGNGNAGILQPAGLHWDNTNGRLGIGTTAPSCFLHVAGTISSFPVAYAVNAASSGTGVVGIGNGATPSMIAAGAGGQFFGTQWGLYAKATNTSGDRAGGYFTNGPNYAYVATNYNSGNNYRIYGSNSCNGVIYKADGRNGASYSIESSEYFLTDFGTGKLTSGAARISLDPDFANNTYISEDHPLKVFIQLEGDCKGVYVANKTQNGFDVIELQGGSSDVPFSWYAVASHADQKDAAGNVVSRYVGVRFPAVPKHNEK